MSKQLIQLLGQLGERDSGGLIQTLTEIEDLNLLPLSESGDWRNYLPKAVVEAWGELPLEAKIVAFMICEPLSNDELA